MAGNPDPKPVPRHKASESEWETLRGPFKGAFCVACPKKAQSLHHLVAKSRGGDDIHWNLAPLCGHGTAGCHGEFENHGPRFREVAGKLRDYICSHPERWAYVHGKLGERVFDKTYPHPNPPVICGNLDCVLPDGHRGSHASLSDRAFVPRYLRQEAKE